MTYDPSIFNISPYYDDFDATKGFLRVLFKPGYALQARELTQLQSVLQDQLSNVGDHLFKDGSRIVGGGISVRNSSYVRVSSGTGTPLAGVTDFTSLVGGFLNDTAGNKAKIVNFIKASATEDPYLILVVDFVSGTSFTSSLTFTSDSSTTNNIAIASGVTYPVQGVCKLISINSGIFYIDGFFVRVEAQNFTPFRVVTGYRDLSFISSSLLFALLSKKIGFAISRDSINDKQDPTLRDPAIGSYNYNAPGADRYKIVLTLAQYDLTETPDDFVELLRFDGGRITKKVDRVTYGDIEKALAQRTYDESGSYTVNPFDLTVKPLVGSSTQYSMSVGKGKAYVLGHELESQHPISINLDRAQTTKTETNLAFPFSVGNYMGVSVGANNDMGDTFGGSLITIGSGSSEIKFRTASNAVVATGYVHGAIPKPEIVSGNGLVGNLYRLYLYGLSGSVSSATKAHLYDNTNIGRTWGSIFPVVSGGSFSIGGSDTSSMVYELNPGYAVESVGSVRVFGKIISDAVVSITTSGSDVTYSFSKSNFTATISAGDASVFSFINYGTSTTTPANSVDLSHISLVYITSGESFTPTSGILTSDGTNVTLKVTNPPSTFTTTNAIRVVVPIIYTPTLANDATYRKKTANIDQVLTSLNSLTNINTDENGRKYFLLSQSDVYAIKEVKLVNATGINITDDFELDDGQRETHYDRSRLYIKSIVSSLDRYTTTGQTLHITYSYFTHAGLASAPFIGKHSYPASSYGNIPLYVNPRTGKSISLANCFDFRHKGLTSPTPMIKPYGRSEFGVAGDTVTTYNHYLPRIDKLCVKEDPEDGSALFFIVKGTPDVSPSAPVDPSNSLVLATLTVPSYTHNPSDVVITSNDSTRFTMSDIGKIQKRVDEVEVFAKLSLSESEIEARSLKATPTTAVEPLKTSIFSDEFYGHSVADVSDPNFSCSIDFERGELRPYFSTSNIVLGTGTPSNTIISTDGLLTLNYSVVSYLDNAHYTTTIQPNPTNTVNWLGFMKLDSSVDPYFDVGYRPVVKTNALKENDNWLSANVENRRGFGTQWNDWESIWTGIDQIDEEQDDIQKRILSLPHTSSASAVPSFNSGNVRVGVSRTVDSIDQKNSNFIRARRLKNRIRTNIGSRVVDRSVVPYIPTKTINVTVDGLKPNATGLSLYFDGESRASSISTDGNGSCSASFTIPSGTFLVGSRVVRISDSPIVANSTIAAEAVYYCDGLMDQRNSGSYSTRHTELRRQTTSSESISKDPFNRNIDSVDNTHWSDPMSQTFYVDKKTTPDGIFLKELDLFFSAKDDTLPITVQIRPTVGGYPSPSVVIPFSTVTKKPADIIVGSSPTATVFEFSSPVYLEPGEYAICVLTNSDDYRLFVSQTAINTIDNSSAVSGRAGNNQLVGTLFTTQGIGAAVEDNSTDMMFNLRRCEFVSSGTATWGSVSGAVDSQILKFYSSDIVPTSCSVTRTINSSVLFNNNETVYLNSLFTSSPPVVYSLVRGSLTTVSPVVDLASLFSIAVKMYGSNATGIGVSRYVSRVVELPEELASNGIAVFLDANAPTGVGSNTNFKVYYRYSLNGESDIFTKPWINITNNRISPEFISESDIDFREASYRVVGGQYFKSYQIKVELTSSANSTYYKTPSLRNIRTVSFIQ